MTMIVGVVVVISSTTDNRYMDTALIKQLFAVSQTNDDELSARVAFFQLLFSSRVARYGFKILPRDGDSDQ